MIRKPAVAGMFYPGNAKELSETVTEYLDNSKIHSDHNTIGIISPHAGYAYSGRIAGVAFSSAPEYIESVIVVAPPHRYPVHGASVYTGEGVETPLGTVATNQEHIHLLQQAGVTYQSNAHLQEHSAEVQIPFIQTRWPDAQVTILLQGDSSLRYSRTLAGILMDVGAGTQGSLIVASTDLSHFHRLSVARALDSRLIDAIVAGSLQTVDRLLKTGRSEACGAGPILTLMCIGEIIRNCTMEELAYDTSATASGDETSVVGYFAAKMTGESND